VDDETYDEIRKSDNRSRGIRDAFAELKERRAHKCAKADPCDREHVDDSEWLYVKRAKKDPKHKGAWLTEEHDGTGWKPSK
jgi:hypothetical protein